jgi:hypothetical protein
VWTSDGTERGTRRLADVSSGAFSSYPGPFITTDSLVFFPATEIHHGRELWALPSAVVLSPSFDCDADGRVSIHDLVGMVEIVLGRAVSAVCPSGDRNDDGAITIDEILAAINAALST